MNPKRSGALASPSTASTSSFEQLPDKLGAFPRYNYEKSANRLKPRIKMENLSDNLGDERMREATVNILNTSMELRKSSESKNTAEMPILTVEHVMEPIEEGNILEENIENRKIIKKQKKTDKNLSLKGKSKIPPLNETADRTESPLPGLLVEATVPHDCSMFSEVLRAKMMQMFQEICEQKSVYESERDSTQNLLDTQRMDSGPSISSVNDWFRRTAPTTNQEEEMTVGFEENVLRIMENLDKTLVERHHDTSKRLAGIFAEAQAKLVQMRRERELLYQKLDKCSQELEEQFMAELKEKCRIIIHEECTKMRAMVSLLKDDVQAVMDFNSKSKKPKKN